MNRKVSFSVGLLISLVAMVSFQNCGSTQLTASQIALSSGIEKLPASNQSTPTNEVVIDEASLYGKVVWTERESTFDRNGQHQTRLDVDLSTAAMSLVKTVGTYSTTTTESTSSCSLADARFNELDNLLKSSRVCRVNDQVKAEQVNCLAIAESDIQLVNSSRNETLELRPNICNSGIFLCDGLDEQLRNLLKDLVLNPPTSCR